MRAAIGGLASGLAALSLAAGLAAEPVSRLRVTAVEAPGLTVSDMDRSIAFFSRVLTFEKVADVEVAGEAYEHLHGVFGLRMRVVRMKLGDEQIELVEYLAPRDGRPYPAEAKAIGLVNEVYPDHAAMMAAVMATAREIAAKNPIAVTGSKVMINYARDHATKEALDYMALWQTGMFARGHMQEAFLAQQEKRAPRYPDLAPVRKKL